MGSAHKNIPPQRKSWEDRFRTPTADELIAAMNKQSAELLEVARERLRAIPGVSEGLSWQGLPWRWTLTYRMPSDNGRAWAYLVPDPAKPQIVLPIDIDSISTLPMHRFKKHVKDGVLQARLVGGVYWATWDITGKGQLTEVLELVHQKHVKATKPPVEAAPAKSGSGSTKPASSPAKPASSPAKPASSPAKPASSPAKPPSSPAKSSPSPVKPSTKAPARTSRARTSAPASKTAKVAPKASPARKKPAAAAASRKRKAKKAPPRK